jgi:hypothetical protein
MTERSKQAQQIIKSHFQNSLIPFLTARMCMELYGIDSRQASGALIALRNQKYLLSIKTQAGMGDLNIYYLNKLAE